MAHVKFGRDGDPFTVPGAGVFARETKADGNDPDLYDMGLVEDFSYEWEGGQNVDVRRPSPGRLRLYTRRKIKEDLMIKFTLGELTVLAIKGFFRCGGVDDIDEAVEQFTPNSGNIVEGWLYLQFYDHHTNELVMTHNAYGQLNMAGPLKGGTGDITKMPVEFTELYSSLNDAGLELDV